MRFALQRLAFSQAESGCYSKFPTSNTRRRRPYTVMFSWSMKKKFTNSFFNKNKTKAFLIIYSRTRRCFRGQRSNTNFRHAKTTRRRFQHFHLFQPQMEYDLSLTEGEKYRVVDNSKINWWKVADSYGREGYAPENYLAKASNFEREK